MPLTPRRRTHSISAPYNFPSPVPSSEDSDIDSSENKSDSETVGHQKIAEADTHDENIKSVDASDEQSSQCGSSADTQTSPEPSSVKPTAEADKYSSVMTKMLFEILQNLLTDILTILEKVIAIGY